MEHLYDHTTTMDEDDSCEEVAAIVTTTTPSRDHHNQNVEAVDETLTENIQDKSKTIFNNTTTTSSSAVVTTDQLERCGKWLSSIPRDDVSALRETKEYSCFLKAFERLGHAHRRVISSGTSNRTSSTSPTSISTTASYCDKSMITVSEHQESCSKDSSTRVSPSSAAHSRRTDLEEDEYMHIDTSAADDFNTVENEDRKFTALPYRARPNILPKPLVKARQRHMQQQQQQQQQQHYLHPSINVFLQHTDDVILRILEFLECRSLIRTSLTCSRFKQLAYRSATQRTYDVSHARQLNNVMQILRAREQIFDGGIVSYNNGIQQQDNSHVRVPILLLSRRIVVTNAGDPEYDGIYYCTTCSGNGFVFTKPRFPIQRVRGRAGVLLDDSGNQSSSRTADRGAGEGEQQRHHLQNLQLQAEVGGNPQGEQQQQHVHNHNDAQQQQQQQQNEAFGAAIPENEGLASRYDGESARPGEPLRCIIAKRFSNETILWYMSKEVETTSNAEVGGGVNEVFTFWSKLMVLGAASPDVCRYPSQSSVLARQNEGWQSLSTTIQPPTVELLD